MKLRSFVGVACLALLAGCIVETRGPANNPPPPPPTATTTAATTPPPPTATTTAPPPSNTVAATATVTTPAGTVGASGEISWGNWLSVGGEKPNDKCVKESKRDGCWDGVDNNCNGEIDEGCPYKTGVLQFIIAWKLGVDLDLHVVGPDGKEVNWNKRELGNGLFLDKDCHGMKNGVDDCPDGKVENVYFNTGTPVMKGHYKVWVEMFDNRGQTKDALIPFTFGGKAGSHVFSVPFFIKNQKGTKIEFSFDVL
jgi:hypothetical protein